MICAVIWRVHAPRWLARMAQAMWMVRTHCFVRRRIAVRPTSIIAVLSMACARPILVHLASSPRLTRRRCGVLVICALTQILRCVVKRLLVATHSIAPLVMFRSHMLISRFARTSLALTRTLTLAVWKRAGALRWNVLTVTFTRPILRIFSAWMRLAMLQISPPVAMQRAVAAPLHAQKIMFIGPTHLSWIARA